MAAAISLFLVYVHLKADEFAIGILGWVLNVAVWLTPFSFAAAVAAFFRSARIVQPQRLLLYVILSCASGAVLWGYVRFDPLLQIDSCFDAGGVWDNGACSR